MDLLPSIHRKQLEVAVAVPMAIGVTAKVQIHFCARGQPELQIAFWKPDGSVFDGQVVALQTRPHSVRPTRHWEQYDTY